MNGFLNQEQINYILYHLDFHLTIDESLLNSIVFVKSEGETALYNHKVIFVLSDMPLTNNEVTYVEDIPVLFPGKESDNPFTIESSNVVFHHDYFKSAFYLLSGYDELDKSTIDSLGRFPYSESIQAKLNIISKPIVNYYFETIIKGIETFGTLTGMQTTRRQINDSFIFSVSHDIDRIKYFSLNSLLYSIKKTISPSTIKAERLKYFNEIFRIGINLIRFSQKEDPYWNFEYLSGKEKRSGINATYFFLPKDKLHVDSYYRLNRKKIKTLMAFLQKQGNEIGLHGTVRSSYSLDALKSILSDFKSVCHIKNPGIRQHRLMWQHPVTAINHDICGFSYDTSLYYAAHEGFRNSYCHPFKLFDFKRNKMLNYWEVPLLVMDTTLFSYRKLTFDEAEMSVKNICREVKRFNGVFTLLWHNTSLDEKVFAGIDDFYFRLISEVLNEKPVVLTGKQIIEKYSSNGRNE